MSSAGSAKTESFNLGAATVMIGPKEQVLDLTPEKHSIGLVKNFTFSANDQYIDLTQGVRNTVVYSVKTGSEITASMEVYEYTSKNLAYALGLEGYELVEGADLALKEVVNGDMVSTEIKVAANADSTESDISVDDYIILQGNKSSNEDLVFAGKVKEVTYTASIDPQVSITSGTVGDLAKALKEANNGYAVMKITGGKVQILAGSSQTVAVSSKFATAFGFTGSESEGMVTIAGTGPATGTTVVSWSDTLSSHGFAAKDTIAIDLDGAEVASVDLVTKPVADTSAYFTVTFDRPIPEGMSFQAGDRAHRANLIPVGSAEAQPTLGAKIVGILPEGKTPITLIIPKLRITNGFNMGFQTDQYGNMPFEFTPFEQIPSDPLYKEYGDKGFAFVLK